MFMMQAVEQLIIVDAFHYKEVTVIDHHVKPILEDMKTTILKERKNM